MLKDLPAPPFGVGKVSTRFFKSTQARSARPRVLALCQVQVVQCLRNVAGGEDGDEDVVRAAAARDVVGVAQARARDTPAAAVGARCAAQDAAAAAVQVARLWRVAGRARCHLAPSPPAL